MFQFIKKKLLDTTTKKSEPWNCSPRHRHGGAAEARLEGLPGRCGRGLSQREAHRGGDGTDHRMVCHGVGKCVGMVFGTFWNICRFEFGPNGIGLEHWSVDFFLNWSFELTFCLTPIGKINFSLSFQISDRLEMDPNLSSSHFWTHYAEYLLDFPLYLAHGPSCSFKTTIWRWFWSIPTFIVFEVCDEVWTMEEGWNLSSGSV